MARKGWKSCFRMPDMLPNRPCVYSLSSLSSMLIPCTAPQFAVLSCFSGPRNHWKVTANHPLCNTYAVNDMHNYSVDKDKHHARHEHKGDSLHTDVLSVCLATVAHQWHGLIRRIKQLAELPQCDQYFYHQYAKHAGQQTQHTAA